MLKLSRKNIFPVFRGVRMLTEVGPQNPIQAQPKVVTAEEAVQCVKSGDRLFFHSAAAFPLHLNSALKTLVGKVKDVECCSIHTEGRAFYNTKEAIGTFRSNNFFLGKDQRTAVKENRADFIPVFLSDIPKLFRGPLPLDVAFVMVSPPDKHGYCTLGISVDVSIAAVNNAKIVVAQVNKHMPRTHGEGIIHISHIDYLVEKDEPLHELVQAEKGDHMKKIGEAIATLIEDGSTLQMGIGAIPDATLACLFDRKDLGIHTEMFSEGVIDLVEKGVITNKYKRLRAGHIIGSFLMGSKRLFNFVDDNPLVQLCSTEFVNDPSMIKMNPKVVAINCAIEVDLTGQICADSIGSSIYSGTGGQVDFERGAALSAGGKPVIALPSRTSSGLPRIVDTLKVGAGVTTTRSHAHYIATEYGIVNVFGKNTRQRAKLLISLAHPDDRKDLTDAAVKRFGVDWLKHN